jgi:hypothetical protein
MFRKKEYDDQGAPLIPDESSPFIPFLATAEKRTYLKLPSQKRKTYKDTNGKIYFLLYSRLLLREETLSYNSVQSEMKASSSLIPLALV